MYSINLTNILLLQLVAGLLIVVRLKGINILLLAGVAGTSFYPDATVMTVCAMDITEAMLRSIRIDLICGATAVLAVEVGIPIDVIFWAQCSVGAGEAYGRASKETDTICFSAIFAPFCHPPHQI